MTTAYTSLLGLALPVTGELSGTWGDVVNAEITSLLDSSIAGTTTLSTDADVTLTTTTGAANQARQMVLLCTGARTGLKTITAPAQSKTYIIINATTGGFDVKIVGVGPTTGVLIPAGVKTLVAWNGSDFVRVASTQVSLTSEVTGTLPATNGGTGQSSYAVGDLLYASTTTALSKLADTATGNALISGGVSTAPAWGKVGLTTHVSGTLPVANGGTGLSTIAARSIPVANTLDTYTTVTPTAGQSIRINLGNTAWEAYTPATPTGTGGTTITGNTTLTSSSAASMTVTPTGPGLYATLPDATTCSKADNLFSLYNAGSYDYGVKNSAGTQLGWVRPRSGAMIGLSDNSTAAGNWSYYGLEKTGATAFFADVTLTATANDTIGRIVLDADRTCFLFGGTSCYAIVYNASTQTWGSATLVASSITSSVYTSFIGVLSATNQVLVCYATDTPTYSSVTLTISANTITVNTPVAWDTPGGVLNDFKSLIAVGSSWVVAYGRSTNIGAIRAITISGTAPTISAETTLYTNASPVNAIFLFASGSVVRTLAADGSSGNLILRCTPYTVSSTTLTVGTGATAPFTAGTGANIRAFLNGNSRIVCQYVNTTLYSAIFSLSSTTESVSSVSMGTAPGNNSVVGSTDFLQITSSKTVTTWFASSTFYCNILTDSSGTASAGTAISYSSGAGSALTKVAAFAISGNNARFGIGNAASYGMVKFDCSGSSPTLSSFVALRGSSSPALANNVNPSNGIGVKAGAMLITGQTAYSLAGGLAVYDLVFADSGITYAKPVSIQSAANNASVSGASNETFFGSSTGGGNTGFTITRVEAAE